MISNLSAGGVEESKSSQQPLLLITNGETCLIQTNMFNNKPLLYDVAGEIPEFLGRHIGCSFGEWVLLIGAGGDILCNLLSKEIIELPFLVFTYNLCILTSHPYDPTCHIVYFSKEENAVIFCQPGDKEFTIKKWDYEFFPLERTFARVAGKIILYIDRPGTFFVVGVIEFKESTYRLEVVKMKAKIRTSYFSNYVYFEYSGELFAVYRALSRDLLMGFEILKADFLKKKWVPVKKLGILAIFIGYHTAHVQCASVESGIKANSIYFLDWYGSDNYYIYNLEEGTVRMKPTISSMEMEKHTKLHWIMMHCEASFHKLLKGDQETICQDSEKENKASVSCSIFQDSEKGKKRKREKVVVQNSWNMVPPELLNLIQLHLFGRDHAVFRLVCEAWQQVSIPDYSIPSIPSLLSSTTLLELCQSSSPLLMFQEDITISFDSVPIFGFFDPIHRKLYRTAIPELRETDIQYSKDGWLLVSRRGDRSIFFFNPLTQEKIELPRMPLNSFFHAEAYSLSFTSLPTCSNCLVVGIASFKMFYTLKHGEQTWRKQGMGEFQGKYARCPVVLNGLHHFMCGNRDMGIFNFKDGVGGQSPCCRSWSTKFEPFAYLHAEDCLIEIDGALVFISVKPDGGEMSIFKWNDLETDWELMEGGVDFGGKEMFLSRRGSFLEKIDGGMGNTIFLPMIDDAKEGVFYSLATHKYHTFYSGYSSELPYNVDKFLNGIWVKPDWKIAGYHNLNWSM